MPDVDAVALQARPLRAVIVDDERLARQRIRRLLQQEPGVEIVGECGSGREAIAAISSNRPDLLFLDIRMPGCDGFDVLRAVGSAAMPFVVFVTAHDDHAIRAFDVQAVDYLLKPIDGERLRRAVSRAALLRGRDEIVGRHARMVALLRAIQAASGAAGGTARAGGSDVTDAPPHHDASGHATRGGHAARLLIRRGGRTRPVPVGDIDWAESLGNYARIHHRGQTDMARTTLSALEQRLGREQFCRIHRSALVNLDRVVELQPWGSGDSIIVLAGGARLRVSRRYRPGLERRLAGSSE
ncbi:MAG: LytR/AlgR family response regulator transcription factor [Gemmatimonadales bacterium]